MAKTIKVIDLLNKIANGQEVPELIEYKGEDYIFKNTDYKNEQRDLYLLSEEIPDITAILNDEVKIIEIIEEQQDIDIQNIEELQFNDNSNIRDTRDLLINELVQAVKQLDKNKQDKE